MRDTLSRRRHFVNAQTREVNAVKCLLRSAGYGSRYKSLKTETAWNKLLDGLSDEATLCIYLNQHFAAWRCAGEHIATLEVMLRQQSSPCKKDLEHLQTIRGVGPVVSTTTVAVLAEPTRFPDAKHAASYVGLVPSTFQSGTRDVHGRITKKGSGELRAMLCEAAQHARNPNHPLSPYFARVAAKKGYKVAIVAVAHRLLRIMYAMLRDGTDFDETKLNVEMKPSTTAKGKKYVLRKRVATVATC
jgi:transposase